MYFALFSLATLVIFNSAHPFEPTLVAEQAISTGTPFAMAPYPTPSLPAYVPVPTPQPSAFTPSQPSTESKTTLTNGIVAAVVFGGVFALAIVVYACAMTYHRGIKPWYRKQRGRGGIEAARGFSVSSEEAPRQMMVHEPVTVPVEARTRVVRGTDGIFRMV